MDDNLECYIELANAIIIKAANDYRRARANLRKGVKIEKSEKTVQEIEDFFFGEWFEILTDADGHEIFTQLEQEEDLNDSTAVSESGTTA